MGHPKKKKATFFKRKSKVLNDSILRQLRLYCAKKIQKLVCDDYFSRYSSDGDFALNPQAEVLMSLLVTEMDAGVPRWPLSNMIEAYAWARRFDALSEKNLAIDLGINPDQVALDKFMAGEDTCRRFNRSIGQIWSSEPINGVGVASVIHAIQQKIASYLGVPPDLSDLVCSFGPGSNTTCTRRTTAKWKLSSPLVCARDSVSQLPELAALFPRLNWKSISAGFGVLSFVPKNAKTSRSIMIEPILGTFVQSGIGRYIKRALLRKGCNLYDQLINKARARLGSLTGKLATVDLSAASDNISREVVRLLLPYNWFEFLSHWRTDAVYYKPKSWLIPLEKFSSMGNGYTFELESCIFYACAQVACEMSGNSQSEASVYGDDIIVPSSAVTYLFPILKLLGFTVNEEKTFIDGPFRESCGGDYLLGIDVRPFYVKEQFSDARLVAFSNNVARSGYPDLGLRRLIESFITPSNKRYGPDGYGDGHLIGYKYEKVPHNDRDGWSGYLFSTYTKIPARDTGNPTGSQLVPFYETYMRETMDYFWGSDPKWHRKNRHSVWIPPEKCFQAYFAPRSRSQGFSREADPHALRGGEQARLIRVYVLS
jgi:hypothetical protein